MSILYFHLHDGVDRLLDEDGSDISLADAPARALKEARAIIADEALNGRIDLRQWIDVEDGDGKVLHSIAFGDAVEIVRAH